MAWNRVKVLESGLRAPSVCTHIGVGQYPGPGEGGCCKLHLSVSPSVVKS